MKCQSLFSVKIKNNITTSSSAEYAYSVVKVNMGNPAKNQHKSTA